MLEQSLMQENAIVSLLIFFFLVVARVVVVYVRIGRLLYITRLESLGMSSIRSPLSTVLVSFCAREKCLMRLPKNGQTFL